MAWHSDKHLYWVWKKKATCKPAVTRRNTCATWGPSLHPGFFPSGNKCNFCTDDEETSQTAHHRMAISWRLWNTCVHDTNWCHPDDCCVEATHTHTHTHKPHSNCVGLCDTECDTGSLVTTQAPSHLIATPSPFSTLLHLLGVPQGSVLGHVTTLLFTQLLFLLMLKNTLSFTTLTLITLNSRNVHHNSYTDNSQLQKSMAPHHIQNLLLSMPKCIDDVKTWLTANSTTTTMKQWLYPLAESRSLSFLNSVGSASVPMSDSQELWCHTWLSLDHENLHLKSGMLSQFLTLPN